MIKLTELLFEGMTPQEAEYIFNKFGVENASSLPKETLKQKYKDLVKSHHPDTGIKTDDMKFINAAYDVLKSPESDDIRRIKQQRDDFNQRYKDFRSHRGGFGHNYENPQDKKDREAFTGQDCWAQAGWGGGYPNNAHIYNEDFGDLNYCKKVAWEISGKPKCEKQNEFNIYQWDGSDFRNSFSVFATQNKLFDISKMMEVWGSSGNPYNTVAVFYTHSTDRNTLHIVNFRGKNMMTHQSGCGEIIVNQKNWYNDTKLRDYLRKKYPYD